MAEFSSLNLGIQDTALLGDYEGAEAFLSDKTLEEIKEEKDKPEEKAEEKTAEKEEITDPFNEFEKPEEKSEGEEEKQEDEEEQEQPSDPTEIEYNALAKDLLRLGIFTEMEDEQEINSPEEFLSRFQTEKQVGATQWLESFLAKFGDDRREMFNAIYIDGVDPKEYLPVYNAVQEFKDLDIANEINQKTVFREYYKRLGWSQEQIEKKLTKTIDYGDLEDEAQTLHSKLVEDDEQQLADLAEKSRQQEENNKRLDTEYKANLQKQLTEAIQKRDFKGVPITEKKANEAFDFLYTPKYKTPDGKVLTEFDKFILDSKKPDNIANRILIALLKTDNFDFSKIEKKAVSKESSSIFSELAQKKVKSKTRDISQVQTTNKNSVWNKL